MSDTGGQLMFGDRRTRPDDDNGIEAITSSLTIGEDLASVAGAAVRQAIDEVIDGGRTGRWCIDQLEKVEKTYIGTIGLRDAGALLGLSYERVRQLHSSEAAGVAPRPGGTVVPIVSSDEL